MGPSDSLLEFEETLKQRYEAIGADGDERGTASDFQLRELEIQTAKSYIRDGHSVLDVGCGTGYSLRAYAGDFKIDGVGIDYAESMVQTAIERAEPVRDQLKGTVSFQQASVLDLPFDYNAFDTVTSARCLMALLDWDL